MMLLIWLSFQKQVVAAEVMVTTSLLLLEPSSPWWKTPSVPTDLVVNTR